MATPSTVVNTVPFQDPQGGLLAFGIITLDLSQPAVIAAGGGDVVPLRVVLRLDSGGNIEGAPVNLWANDQLVPTGTSYRMRVYNSNNLLVGDWGQQVFAGAPPIDISQLVPTSSSPSGGGGGGSIGGSIGANQVAFGSAPDTIAGSAGFTFNSTAITAALTKGSTATAAMLDVNDNATVATNPNLGTVIIRGKALGGIGASGPSLLTLIPDASLEGQDVGWVVGTGPSSDSFISAQVLDGSPTSPLITMFNGTGTMVIGVNDLGSGGSIDSAGGDLTLRASGNNIILSNSTIQITSTITSYNSTPTAAAGVAAIYAAVDLTVQAANIGTTTLFAVPVGKAGMYRYSAYIVITQAASASSTLPNVVIGWTDADSSTSETFAATATEAGNTVGVFGPSNSTLLGINAKASTNITYATTNYASIGGTAMQYALHIRLEYLG